MTHEYTVLTGGTVIAGGNAPDATAIAWAHDTVLAIGGDDEVRAISRGDSHFHSLGGAFVVGAQGSLEAGGPADFSILAADPRLDPARAVAIALVRGGRVIKGQLGDLRAGSG